MIRVYTISHEGTRRITIIHRASEYLTEIESDPLQIMAALEEALNYLRKEEGVKIISVSCRRESSFVVTARKKVLGIF